MTDKNNIQSFGKGLIQSPHDPRDYSLSSVSPVIMRYPDICPSPFDLTILNQGQLPQCVAYATCEMKQEKGLFQKITESFDPQWLFTQCKAIDGHPELQGTFLRVAMQVAQKVGMKTTDSADPTPFKVLNYALIDDLSFEGLKKAIFLYGAILVGFRGSNEGWQGEYIRPPLQGEAVWQHAVILNGYEHDYIIGQNSWGTGWGNQGLFKVDRNYSPFEGWAIVVDSPVMFQPIKTGWVANTYLQLIGGVWRSTQNLNVRSGVGTSSPIIKTIPQGTIVQFVDSPTLPANGFVWQQIVI